MGLLDLVHLYSKERVTVPIKVQMNDFAIIFLCGKAMLVFQTHLQEVGDLVASINLHQKYDKINRKLRASLEEIEAARKQAHIFSLHWFSWFIEGSLSVITIYTLVELPDWKGFAAFVLLMSCNAVNHGPGLTHLRDLEHLLAGR